MAQKKSYVTAKLNKRRYSSEIAMFDMYVVIRYNTFIQDHDTTHWSYCLTVNEWNAANLWHFLPLGDYCSLQ